MKYLGWALVVVIAALTVDFAVNNFARTAIDLWPLPIALELPLFAIVLLSVFFGFCVGWIVVWWSGVRARNDAARAQRDLARAKQDLDDAKRKIAALEQHPALPAHTTPHG